MHADAPAAISPVSQVPSGVATVPSTVPDTEACGIEVSFLNSTVAWPETVACAGVKRGSRITMVRSVPGPHGTILAAGKGASCAGAFDASPGELGKLLDA